MPYTADPVAPGAPAAAGHVELNRELDHARKHGALREIVIPPCPDLLARLQAAMASDMPDLAEIGRIAASDVAMAATLIRNANGALYAAGQPVQTVGQAMNRIGLRHTAALMTGFLARHAIPASHPRLARFWVRATLRAMAQVLLARRQSGADADLAYTFGLFCHVGMPVLLQSLRGYGGTLVEAEARIDRPFIATENANHRTDHAVVGALVARTWRLAPEVALAIRLHHDFSAMADARTPPVVRRLVAAGLVAEHLMRRSEGLAVESEWRAHGDHALAHLGLGAAELDALDAELRAHGDVA